MGRGAVNACVGRAPGLQGWLVMRLALPSAGGIADVAVAGVGDEALHRCVTDALLGTAMPQRDHGGTLVLNRFAVVVCPDGTTVWPTGQGFH